MNLLLFKIKRKESIQETGLVCLIVRFPLHSEGPVICTGRNQAVKSHVSRLPSSRGRYYSVLDVCTYL